MLRHSQTRLRNSTENNKNYQKLSKCSRSELYQLRQKNLKMLNNNAILQNLSDKGAKLKETNEQIEQLLIDERTASAQDTITVENTSFGQCPLTKRLEAMSLLTARQGARKKSVDLANEQALCHKLPRRLLKMKRASSCHYPMPPEKVKAKMITINESLNLQNYNTREDAFDVENPSINLLKSLNLSLRHIPQKDKQEYELPLEKESEDDSDSMDIDQ